MKARSTTVVHVALLLALVTASGCMLMRARKSLQHAAQYCKLTGTVTTEEPSEHPIVVVLFRPDDEKPQLVDHFVLRKPGRWVFTMPAGTYALAAFEDVTDDLVYHPDEPTLGMSPEHTWDLVPGDVHEGIDLVIPTHGRGRGTESIDIADWQARSAGDQVDATMGQLTVAGDVTDLDHERFNRTNASKGLWEPMKFLFDVGAGVYFLEEYSPRKTPVLYVHGIGGTPQEFGPFIEGLDHERFQPWVYYYPSAAHLDRIAENLSQIMVRLKGRFGFEELYVVAHSMGGLVSRAFIQRHHEIAHEDLVELFVTIATPFGGHGGADLGLKSSPVKLPVWTDMSPSSEFIDKLFYLDPGVRKQRHHLPPGVEYHVLFAFRRRTGRLGASGDGIVVLSSQLRPEVQEEALSMRGYDYNHTGILRAEDVSDHLNQILATERD